MYIVVLRFVLSLRSTYGRAAPSHPFWGTLDTQAVEPSLAE